ncbi:hypothetical protein ACNO7T_22925 [Vibrio campbellii]
MNKCRISHYQLPNMCRLNFPEEELKMESVCVDDFIAVELLDLDIEVFIKKVDLWRFIPVANLADKGDIDFIIHLINHIIKGESKLSGFFNKLNDKKINELSRATSFNIICQGRTLPVHFYKRDGDAIHSFLSNIGLVREFTPVIDSSRLMFDALELLAVSNVYMQEIKQLEVGDIIIIQDVLKFSKVSIL